MKYIDVVDERIRVLASIKDNWYTDEDFPNGIGKSFSELLPLKRGASCFNVYKLHRLHRLKIPMSHRY